MLTDLKSIETPVSNAQETLVNWPAIVEEVTKKIPPLWPLKSFVAVNPFLEWVDQPFDQVVRQINQIVPGGMLIERSYFRDKFDDGKILPSHLKNAFNELKSQADAAARPFNFEGFPEQQLVSWLDHTAQNDSSLPTLLAMIDQTTGSHWENDVTNEISTWLGHYLDHGQAVWSLPGKAKPILEAWLEFASLSRNIEFLGLKNFRKFVKSLPVSCTTDELLQSLLERLDLPPRMAHVLLMRELQTLSGWASALKFREKQQPETKQVAALLAIRLTYVVAIYQQFATPQVARIKNAYYQNHEQQRESESLTLHLIWQLANEIAYREELFGILPSSSRAPDSVSVAQRPDAQLVFCIDVRSEPMRRAVESTHSNYATMGYAGFFGVPIAANPFGSEQSTQRCPVILDPPYQVSETPQNPEDHQMALQRHQRHTGLNDLFKTFKDSAISCFTFVETTGLCYAWNLARDSWRQSPTRTKAHFKPILDPEDLRNQQDKTAPQVARLGIPPADQVKLAQGIIKALNLGQNAARLVVLCGHGATTHNNPYDSGLQCGACGGHAGDLNAQLAAEMLNRPSLRSQLKSESAEFSLPEDTIFVAARHDTTLDQVTLFDEHLIPESHQQDLANLKNHLEQASQLASLQRAPKLGIAAVSPASIQAELARRAADWSQVRPEWGLAGNAAFIIADRKITRDCDLSGRAFLHHYQNDQDPEGELLAGILGGPLVVGSWINLQYFASSSNNQAFGSGNKTLHNISGTHGVQLGNGGDLKTGLPLQSIHDGQTLQHEPIRLHVLIEAPTDKARYAIAQNPTIQNLYNNHWLHFFAIDTKGQWQPL